LLHQGALLVFGSMSGALPITFAAYLAVCLVWLKATLGLARDMDGADESKVVSVDLGSGTHTHRQTTGMRKQASSRCSSL
jgi:hypothetical protein